jgi:hypothetical protein
MMAEETRQYLGAAVLTIAGILAVATAWSCGRRGRSNPSSVEAAIWAAIALVFLLLAWVEVAHPGRWLEPALRQFGRDHHQYFAPLSGARRKYQIVATAGVALAAGVLLAIGVFSARDHLKRHRLAIGAAAVVAAYGSARFVSLDELDSWKATSWPRVLVAFGAGAAAAVAAVARLRQRRA